MQPGALDDPVHPKEDCDGKHLWGEGSSAAVGASWVLMAFKCTAQSREAARRGRVEEGRSWLSSGE